MKISALSPNRNRVADIRRRLADLDSQLAELEVDAESEHEEPPVPRVLFSPVEFAAAIGMSSTKIYSLIGRGMPTIRIGAQQRIELAPAIEWLRVHGADEAAE